MQAIFKTTRIFIFLYLLIPFQLRSQDSLATIYFYSSIKFPGVFEGRTFEGYDVKWGDVVIGRMKPGEVVSCRTKPGTQTFAARVKNESSFRLTVEGSKTYFVECGIAIELGRPTFRVATNTEGRTAVAGLDKTTKAALYKEDTVKALNNLFHRKRKGGAWRGGFFLGAALGGVATGSETGDYSGAILFGIISITGFAQISKYSSEEMERIITDYSKGIHVPANFRRKLRKKDFD